MEKCYSGISILKLRLKQFISSGNKSYKNKFKIIHFVKPSKHFLVLIILAKYQKFPSNRNIICNLQQFKFYLSFNKNNGSLKPSVYKHALQVK